MLTVASVVAPAFAGNLTVGRFYTDLAQAKHLEAVDVASAEASLHGAGIDLPRLALDKSLTEGDMTSISKAIGVAVMTQRPSQPVSGSLLNTFMAVFARQLGEPKERIGNPFSTNDDDRRECRRRHRSRCTPDD